MISEALYDSWSLSDSWSLMIFDYLSASRFLGIYFPIFGQEAKRNWGSAYVLSDF